MSRNNSFWKSESVKPWALISYMESDNRPQGVLLYAREGLLYHMRYIWYLIELPWHSVIDALISHHRLFTGAGTQVKRGWGTCPWSHSYQVEHPAKLLIVIQSFYHYMQFLSPTCLYPQGINSRRAVLQGLGHFHTSSWLILPRTLWGRQ